MKKSLMIATVSGLWLMASCSADTEDAPLSGQTQCASAKCDGTGLAELSAIPTQFGSCEIVPELEGDPDFARDQWNCQFAELDEGFLTKLERIYTWTTNQQRLSNGVYYDLMDSSSQEAGQWIAQTGYPLTTNINISFDFPNSDNGRLGSPNISHRTVSFDETNVIETRPDAVVQQNVSLPFEFWPVVIWPSLEFSENFSADDYSTLILEITGEVGFTQYEVGYSYGRFAVTGDDLRQFTSKTFFLPQQAGRVPKVEVRLNGNSVTATAEITGPGYYLLNADGSLTKASTAEVLELGISRIAGDIPATPEPDPTVNPIIGPEPDPLPNPEPTPDVDPCDGACSNAQACVNANCVLRSTQIQFENCTTPHSVCESTSDCADAHACVEGTCRRLSCQIQFQNCNTPHTTCESTSDCADSHACVDGACRRLSCQIQFQNCNPPHTTCESTSDCAEAHSCVDGTCRRLTCQIQFQNCSTPSAACYTDFDCANDHACAEGLCRRLTCQTQSQTCDTPNAVCDGGEIGDCADGHVCDESRCKRLTCLR